MIENFKLKVFRVVADNLNYRRADVDVIYQKQFGVRSPPIKDFMIPRRPMSPFTTSWPAKGTSTLGAKLHSEYCC